MDLQRGARAFGRCCGRGILLLALCETARASAYAAPSPQRKNTARRN